MALMTAKAATDAAGGARRLHLGDLRSVAEQLVDQAKVEAAKIVADAEAERERLIGDAQHTGHAEGYKRGHAEGSEAGRVEAQATVTAEMRERLDALTDSWLAAAESLAVAVDGIRREATDELLMLAVRLAEVIAMRTIEADAEAAALAIQAVLERSLDAKRVTVRVAEEDLEIAELALDRLLASVGQGRRVSVVGDATLQAGSAIADLPSGASVDASVQTRLERVADAVLGERSGDEKEAA